MANGDGGKKSGSGSAEPVRLPLIRGIPGTSLGLPVAGPQILLNKLAKVCAEACSLQLGSLFGRLQDFGIKTRLNIHCID